MFISSRFTPEAQQDEHQQNFQLHGVQYVYRFGKHGSSGAAQLTAFLCITCHIVAVLQIMMTGSCVATIATIATVRIFTFWAIPSTAQSCF